MLKKSAVIDFGDHLGIVLFSRQIALVDLEDEILVKNNAWYCLKKGGTCYARHKFSVSHEIECLRGQSVLMHRLILNLLDSPGRHVDHINHDGLDNRRSNLRIVTREQNMQNRIIKKGGVTYRGNGIWRARIGVNGKKINIGHFKTKEEALHARQFAEKKYFGEFALTGKPGC